MSNNQSPEPLKIEPALLSIPQVCEYLNVSTPTYYRIASSGVFGPLPVQLCRKVLYRRGEIEGWIGAGCPHRKIWQSMKKGNKL